MKCRHHWANYILAFQNGSIQRNVVHIFLGDFRVSFEVRSHFYLTLNWMMIQFADDENGCKNDCFGVIKEILLKYAFILYRYLPQRKRKIHFFQLLKIKNLSFKSFKLTSTKYPCICWEFLQLKINLKPAMIAFEAQ